MKDSGSKAGSSLAAVGPRGIYTLPLAVTDVPGEIVPLGVGGMGANVPVALGDILEMVVSCWFAAQVQLGLNVRHYRVASLGTAPPTLGTCADALSVALATKYTPLLSASAQYWGTSMRRINPLPPTSIGFSDTGRAVGTIAADPLPKQTSGLITLRTALAGRAYRGRTYIPFPGESDNTATCNPSVGYQAGLSNLAAVLLSIQTVGGAQGAQLQPVIWHRRTRTTTDIIVAAGSKLWATQRRRGDFGRQNVVPFP